MLPRWARFLALGVAVAENSVLVAAVEWHDLPRMGASAALGARGGARRKAGGVGGGGDAPATMRLLRIGFQGLPGAYSEKATRALLGPHVLPVGHDTFDDTFRALVAGRVDYAMLPIENSLGGSIHANYDLLLRCARALARRRRRRRRRPAAVRSRADSHGDRRRATAIAQHARTAEMGIRAVARARRQSAPPPPPPLRPTTAVATSASPAEVRPAHHRRVRPARGALPAREPGREEGRHP